MRDLDWKLVRLVAALRRHDRLARLRLFRPERVDEYAPEDVHADAVVGRLTLTKPKHVDR